MQVRKRNGNIVDYDREFIVRAVTLAAAAARGPGNGVGARVGRGGNARGGAAGGRRERRAGGGLPDGPAVFAALGRQGGNPPRRGLGNRPHPGGPRPGSPPAGGKARRFSGGALPCGAPVTRWRVFEIPLLPSRVIQKRLSAAPERHGIRPYSMPETVEKQVWRKRKNRRWRWSYEETEEV